MIFAKPTKHGAGIIIHGEYYDLMNLHESICYLTENTVHRAAIDKGYSLTDCISMIEMRKQSIGDVLTHDRHFAQEGFNLLFR